MNIQNNINKLLYALSQKGQLYKINSFKYYSEINNKYCTKYQILKKQVVELSKQYIDDEEPKIEQEERFLVDYDCYSKVDLMKYLIKEYKQGSEANE